MLRYIIRRLLWVVVLLFAVSALTFVIFYVFPSADPAVLRAGRNANPEAIAQLRHALKLDKPVYVQYLDYMQRAFLHFDFGFSFQNDISVKKQIFDRLPATASLALGAAVVWLIAGITVGIISAIKRHTFIDRAAMTGALIAISSPVYWLGLLGLFLFATDIGKFHIFKGAGTYRPITDDPSAWFGSLILPWLVLAAAFAAFYARLLRASLIEVMGEDYIRTARAKGLKERDVIFRHGMRSAITPLVTALGLDIGVLLGGAILTESVFNIPGIGRLAFDAILNSDLPTIQGTVLLGAFFIVIANLVVDIAYAFLDPRVRY
jgi:peptide/nickel transport system permease protein